MHQKLTTRLLEYREKLKTNHYAEENYLATISVYGIDKRIPNVFRSVFADYKKGDLFVVRFGEKEKYKVSDLPGVFLLDVRRKNQRII